MEEYSFPLNTMQITTRLTTILHLWYFCKDLSILRQSVAGCVRVFWIHSRGFDCDPFFWLLLCKTIVWCYDEKFCLPLNGKHRECTKLLINNTSLKINNYTELDSIISLGHCLRFLSPQDQLQKISWSKGYRKKTKY